MQSRLQTLHASVMSGSRAEWVEEAGRVLREQAGIDLVAMRPTMAGESGAAFWITERAGAVMLLKIRPGPAQDAVDYLRKLDAAAGRLRDRGYPAPRYHVIGQAAGVAFWVQERPLVMADLTGGALS